MATADELIMQITGEDYHEDLQFIIDENLRTIAIPKDGVVLGVCGDKDINRVNFRMNRYYNGFDMSEFNIRINYINANGEPNYFVVSDIQVDVEYIIFTWLVEAHATRYVGEVSFCVRLFTESEGKIDSQFFSTIGKAVVLENIDVDSMVPEEEVVDMITKLINGVMEALPTAESEVY